MLRRVALLVALVAACGCATVLVGGGRIRGEGLLGDIRRQLMTDNYDYSGPAAEGPAAEGPAAEGPAAEGPAAEGPAAEGPAAEGPAAEGPAAEGPAAEGPAAEGPAAEGPAAEGPAAEGPAADPPAAPPAPARATDLLYYVDERHLAARGGDGTFDTSDEGAEWTTGPAARYKVLKVKEMSPSRRSGSYRRFLQERSPGGVALVSLDRRPFPEFRLPRRERSPETARPPGGTLGDSGSPGGASGDLYVPHQPDTEREERM